MRVAVLAGGRSAEREVSLRSGAQCAAALRSAGHVVTQLDLDGSTWDALRDGAFDCVFIALHGRLGEDGSVQGMCELLRLPYTGCGILSSALCIDKTLSNRLLAAAGLPVPEFEELAAVGDLQADTVERLVRTYGLPLVVKPVREGSTIGLTVARSEDAVGDGLVLAGRYDRRVLVQRFVRGTEITVGVLATPDVQVLPTLEITYEEEEYSYHAKYTAGASHHIIPARLPEPTRERAARLSEEAFRVLGCEGMARIDFIVDAGGEPWILEVNTVPGMTELSLLPDAARAAGIEFPDLCDRLVRHAVERAVGTVGP